MWRRLLILFFFQMALFPGNAAATDLIWGAVVDLDRATGTLNLRMMGASEKSAFHRARHERVRVRFFPEDLPDGIRPGTIVNIWGEPIPGKTPAFTATAIQRERRAHADPTGVRSRLGRAGHNGAGGHGSGPGGGGGGGGSGGGGGGSGGGGGGSGGGGGGGGGR